MDPFDNDFDIALYDFDNPINQAEEEGEEDCELPKEIARMLEQEIARGKGHPNASGRD